MRPTIFTAVFGNRDSLRDPRVVENADYICFSDRKIKSKVWDVVHVRRPLYQDPCRAAKVYKVLCHNWLPSVCTRSIWIDANIELMNPITHLLDEMKTDLAFFKHPHPHEICIYREASVCIRKNYDDSKAILKTIKRYRAEGHPENWGLPMGRFILRKHTAMVKEFGELWWKEITNGTRRDQLSLPVVLRHMQIPFDEFNPYRLYNVWNMGEWHPNQLAKLHGHNSKGK